MSIEDTAFYRNGKEFIYDFEAPEISSDGGFLLLFKLLRNAQFIKQFMKMIPDRRDPDRITHSVVKMFSLRILMNACGYEDCNDIEHLSDDPLLNRLYDDGLCSQPVLSRLENSLSRTDLYQLACGWVDQYVAGLSSDRSKIIIDVDCTDDPTHGAQQGSLFNGFHYQYMLNELFYIDGQTGQIILPVLRPGNVHTSKWNERFLSLIVEKIRARFGDIRIIIRTDAGYSNPAFYQLAERNDVDFCIGISSNSKLKEHIEPVYDEVKRQYADNDIKHQQFVGPFTYQANSWEESQQVCAKIESTGQGMNVRFIVSNLGAEDPESLYKVFYVQRGETAENRIKEIKNMCKSDRLSCHCFSANYLRFMIYCLSYELLRLLRRSIRQTKHTEAGRWTIQSIRIHLLKLGAQIRQTTKRVYVSFSRAFSQQNLFRELVRLC